MIFPPEWTLVNFQIKQKTKIILFQNIRIQCSFLILETIIPHEKNIPSHTHFCSFYQLHGG